jgi:hypothetical protein
MTILPNGDLVAGGQFTTAGGRVSAYWARWGLLGVRGDSNGDRLIDAFDVDCLVAALAGGSTSWSACGTSSPSEAYLCVNDINGDGAENSFDIDGFVSCLLLGACS